MMIKKSSPSVGVAIMTHNSKKHLLRCLKPLLQSPNKLSLLVVNSSSSDGTVEMARDLGADVLIVKREEFNHGTTRELARNQLQTDIVVMLTPDAYFVDEFACEKLIAPIVRGDVAAAYGRQIPHSNADVFESFPRDFNYPEESYVRHLHDVDKHGTHTFFFSNSCAAYSSQALDDIGGFPPVLLGEDTIAAAKLLRKGYAIAYVAEAVVHHSHRYSLMEEFRRSFDTGLARKDCAYLLEAPIGDSHRGYTYARALFKRLYKENPIYIPYGLSHVAAKFLGYYIGKNSSKAPVWFKKKMSSQDFYWNR